MSQPPNQFLHDPQAVLDYIFDWSTWLPSGDTIATHTVVGSGVTIDSDALAGAIVTAWVSGGTLGAIATVTCHIVTTEGREDDRTFRLKVSDR